MRDDLDDIKIDENGDFRVEDLATEGTKPLIGILYGALNWAEDEGKGVVFQLISTALEKAQDLDVCIQRLVDEQLNKKKQNRA